MGKGEKRSEKVGKGGKRWGLMVAVSENAGFHVMLQTRVVS